MPFTLLACLVYHAVYSACLSSLVYHAVYSACLSSLVYHAVYSACLVYHAVYSACLSSLVYHAVYSACLSSLVYHAVYSVCLSCLPCRFKLNNDIVAFILVTEKVWENIPVEVHDLQAVEKSSTCLSESKHQVEAPNVPGNGVALQRALEHPDGAVR